MAGDILAVDNLPAPGQGPCGSKAPELQRVETSCSAPWLTGETGAADVDALSTGVNRSMCSVGQTGQGIRGSKGRRMPHWGQCSPVLSTPHPTLPAQPAWAGQAVQIAPAIRLSSQKARRLKERENLLERDRQPPPRPAQCNPWVSRSKRGRGSSTPGHSTKLLPNPIPSGYSSPSPPPHQEWLARSCAVCP